MWGVEQVITYTRFYAAMCVASQLYAMRELTAVKFEDGEPRYEWASTHPWMSWRERYRKNQARFDVMIKHILESDPPDPSGKGQYYYRRNKAIHVRSEEEEEEEEEEIDISDDSRASKSRPAQGRPDVPPLRKKPRTGSDGTLPFEQARERQQRERTAEAQIAGPSRSQREKEYAPEFVPI